MEGLRRTKKRTRTGKTSVGLKLQTEPQGAEELKVLALGCCPAAGNPAC